MKFFAVGLVAVMAFGAMGVRAAPDAPNKASSDAKADASHEPASESQAHTLLPRWREHITLEHVAAAPPDVTHRLLGKIGYDDEHTQKVLAPLAGRVTRVFVQPGAEIKQNTALLELDSPELAALVAQQTHSALDVKQAEAAATRADALLADGAISTQEAALARAELLKARAEGERLNAHLRALSLEPLGGGRGRLVAQLDGRVTARHVHAGQQLRGDETEPLMVVSNLSRVWVWAELHEQELAALPHTGHVVVRTPAYPGRTFAGALVAEAETLDPISRTLWLRGVLENPKLELRPAMAASVELPLHAAGTWVSRKAVLFDGAGPYVVRVEGNSQVRRCAVTLGLAIRERQQVLHGLKAGETVIGQGALLVAQELGL